MYEYTQQLKAGKGLARRIAVAAYVIGGVIALIASGFREYAVFAWIAAVVFLGVGVCMSVIYLLRILSYRIEDRTDTGKYDFVIVESKNPNTRAERRIVHVRLSFETQIREFITDPERIRALRRTEGIKTYVYTLELAPKSPCALLAEDGDDTVLVVFTPDDTMRQRITGLLARGK